MLRLAGRSAELDTSARRPSHQTTRRRNPRRRCSGPGLADLTHLDEEVRNGKYGSEPFCQQQSLTLVAGAITDPDAAAPLALQLDVLAGQKRSAQADRKALLDRRAGWQAAQHFLEDIAATCERIKRRLDGFTHAQWQQAIDAFRITATVWPEGSAERFRLHVGLTPDLTRHLPELVLDYPASAVLEGTASAKLDSTC
jgi:hypothetical protein